jgi:low affinity Fe/Cu permease
MKFATYFSVFSNWLAKWTGSHWAITIAAVLVAASLILLGIDRTNIAISVVTLLMLFILQNTQNRDSAALHVKLDEVITHLQGPRDEVAGIESKTDDQIEELRVEGHDEEPVGWEA